MTDYDIHWSPDAEEQLAEIWLDSQSPSSVTFSQHSIDLQLSRHPNRVGWEISEGLRGYSDGTLTVFYSVRDDDFVVEIEAVRLARI